MLMSMKNKATKFVVNNGISFLMLAYTVQIDPLIRLINTIGKLIYRQSLSLMTSGIWPRVEKYVDIERNDATDPVMNAGITLLKKNSAIDTSRKHAITCARVLFTCKYSVINVIPTKQPRANNIRMNIETYPELLEFRC